MNKHPSGQPAHPDSIIKNDQPDIHPVLFDLIDAFMIVSVALQTGFPGLDASSWRKLCNSFKYASFDLCHSPASVAKRLCTNFIDPSTIAPLLACHLVALNKNPGVRPIGWRHMKMNYGQSHSNCHQDGHPGSSWLHTALCLSDLWY